jgi:HlyD family secretion protein
MKRLIIAFLIIGGIGGGVAAFYMRRGGGEIQVNSLPVTRGPLIDAVASTGTVQPVVSVTVGSQVSGNISELDVDFNSPVKEGQIIAKIDPTLLQAQVDQSKAALLKSQADRDKAKVAVEDAKQKLTRAQNLAAKQLIDQQDLDSAVIAAKSADAALDSAEKTVVQQQATLSQNQTNVEHCIIKAPIDGIITQRSVDVGQTVAASMSAPTLFIIAADLTKMEINASVDESDVGRIRPGQKVTFRVDTYPGQEFGGVVAQVRLQPTVVQNVTTYSTIIAVPNPDFKLKPGMTANLKIQIDTRANAIRVPNAATRFRPTNDMFAALNQPVPPEAQPGGGRGGRGGRGGQGADAAAPAQTASATGAAASGEGGAAAAGEGGRGRGRRSRNADDQGAAADAGAGGGGRGARRGGADGQTADAQSGGGRGGRRGRGGNNLAAPAAGAAPAKVDDANMNLAMFRTLTTEQQQEVVDRLKARGEDTSTYEDAMRTAAAIASTQKYGDPLSAQTIDALFPPLVNRTSRQRVWEYQNNQLKPVNVTLGITDGTQTELLDGSLDAGAELVTGMVLPGGRSATASNPLLQGGRGPGGFPGGGGGGRGR